MSDFKVKSKTTNGPSALANMCTLGLYPKSYDYVVEHKGSNDKQTINAFNGKDLGEKISRGKK